MQSRELAQRARDLLEKESRAVQSLALQIGPGLSDTLDLMLGCEGHVLVTGAGTSHAVAQRFAHLLSCSGTPALCIDAGDSMHGGSGAVRDTDVVFAISKGGQTAEVNELARIARRRGARVIAQTENPDSPLAELSDAVYLVRAPEGVDPYGMIATGSSLVNAAAGDVLCGLLLEARGYSRDAFGETHPGGAVGKKLEENEPTPGEGS